MLAIVIVIASVLSLKKKVSGCGQNWNLLRRGDGSRVRQGSWWQ